MTTKDKDLERDSFDLSGREKKKGGGGRKGKSVIVLIIAFLVIVSGIGFGVKAIFSSDSSAEAEAPQKKDAALEHTDNGDSSLERLQAGEVQAQREKADRERRDKERLAAEKAKQQSAANAEARKNQQSADKKKPNSSITGDKEKDEPKGNQKGKKVQTPDERKASGEILVTLPKSKSQDNGDSGNGGDSGSSGSLTNRDGDKLNTTKYEDGSVSIMSAVKRKFLLKRFTKLRCALYTEIITDHPGPIECYLTKDLYSADGSVILARAGAQLTGERKVALAAGQASIFTNWASLELANGVSAQLNSLGTSPLGATGTEAWIDNHYGERFGSAMLLSLFDDTLATLESMASDDEGDITYDNSSDTASDMASTALQQSINIAPTGHVLPGSIINVLVVRDVDFTPVYSVR